MPEIYEVHDPTWRSMDNHHVHDFANIEVMLPWSVLRNLAVTVYTG